jgi:hypothetical protein
MKLVPLEHSFITPTALGGLDLYKQFCDLVGLIPVPNGYGVLHCIDKDDAKKHWTLVTTDVDYVRGLIGKPLRKGGFKIPPGKFRLRREGWPDEWIKGH